jgi:hypothetical protein
MQYRKFGPVDATRQTGWDISALGFGTMRLPIMDDDLGRIDEPKATRMIRHAIDAGVNYIDTAYPYHQGASEIFLGRALQDGYRDRIQLATKMPYWLVEQPSDFDRYLNEQLDRLQTDSIDVYLLHAMVRKGWEKIRDLGVRKWADRALADRRIRHIGFSFHDDYELFTEIVDAYDRWSMCQIQYNYMDVDYQAGTKGLKYAAGKGLAVVIMEPLRGGLLAKIPPPDPVARLWAAARRERTPADWALQWLWHQPEVSCVLSGMSTMQHVVENLSSADASGVGSLDASELILVAEVRKAYQALRPIACTGCRYCMPCPQGVAISEIFAAFNDAAMYDGVDQARRIYRWLREDREATSCVACGTCQDRCPQGLEIVEWLNTAQQMLGGS